MAIDYELVAYELNALYDYVRGTAYTLSERALTDEEIEIYYAVIEETQGFIPVIN